MVGSRGLLVAGMLMAVCHAATVKYYLNQCFDDLSFDNYHNYTGRVVDGPPNSIEKYSSVMLFQFEYADTAEFGSLLDWNINYYTPASQTLSTAFHIFSNVNETGGVYLSVQPPDNFNGSGCMDVANNAGTLPSVIGVYAWFTANQTEAECKTKTKNIEDCTYALPNNG